MVLAAYSHSGLLITKRHYNYGKVCVIETSFHQVISEAKDESFTSGYAKAFWLLVESRWMVSLYLFRCG
jgi:hypothetical protein